MGFHRNTIDSPDYALSAATLDQRVTSYVYAGTSGGVYQWCVREMAYHVQLVGFVAFHELLSGCAGPMSAAKLVILRQPI